MATGLNYRYSFNENVDRVGREGVRKWFFF